MTISTDDLAGRELDGAVAIAAGWQTERWGIGQHLSWRGPHGERSLGANPPAFDLGAAMKLLLDSGKHLDIKVHYSGVAPPQIYIRHKRKLLASGPISEAASVCCRAFLKLKKAEASE